jgi:hypothetical protein
VVRIGVGDVSGEPRDDHRASAAARDHLTFRDQPPLPPPDTADPKPFSSRDWIMEGEEFLEGVFKCGR